MKIKSVLKTICFGLAIVIICYIEGKFNFLPNSKSTMASRRILSADFEVFGIVQGM